MSARTNQRFAFYVTGGASRLTRALQRYPQMAADIALVVNDQGPNPGLRATLAAFAIEYIEFSYSEKNVTGAERNTYISNLLLEQFQQRSINYAFCFGSRILKGQLLEVFRNRIINFHPSVLPAFPGLKSIDQALAGRAFLLGNTAHFIDAGTDTGPVIMQSAISTHSYTGYEDVLGLQLPMLFQIYLWLNEGRITVEDSTVRITKAGWGAPVFFPSLEIPLVP